MFTDVDNEQGNFFPYEVLHQKNELGNMLNSEDNFLNKFRFRA